MSWDSGNMSAGMELGNSGVPPNDGEDLLLQKASGNIEGGLTTESFSEVTGDKYYCELYIHYLEPGEEADMYLGMRRTSDTPVQGVNNIQPSVYRYALLQGTGNLLVSDQVTAGTDNPGAFAREDRLMLAIDYLAKRLWIGVNGVWGGGVNPATAAGGAASGWPDGMLFSLAHVSGAGSFGNLIELIVNADFFAYAVPVGFTPFPNYESPAFWTEFVLTEEVIDA